MNTVLRAQGLGKKYRRRWALSDCTLDVPAGRVVGLVGPNGAGKTTLLHLAVGLLTPTCGAIEVLGGRPAAGWKRWIMVTGTVHQSFTDLGVFAGQLGIDIGATIDPDRALAITRAYTKAFFDLHLRGTPQPLMTAPSPSYPEVTFIG